MCVVERRRRDNINDRIQELAVVVPECTATDGTGALKLNKAVILKKSIDYIKNLQRANQELRQCVHQLESALNPDQARAGTVIPDGVKK